VAKGGGGDEAPREVEPSTPLRRSSPQLFGAKALLARETCIIICTVRVANGSLCDGKLSSVHYVGRPLLHQSPALFSDAAKLISGMHLI
jgi:hypothetical protein